MVFANAGFRLYSFFPSNLSPAALGTNRTPHGVELSPGRRLKRAGRFPFSSSFHAGIRLYLGPHAFLCFGGQVGKVLQLVVVPFRYVQAVYLSNYIRSPPRELRVCVNGLSPLCVVRARSCSCHATSNQLRFSTNQPQY